MSRGVRVGLFTGIGATVGALGGLAFWAVTVGVLASGGGVDRDALVWFGFKACGTGGLVGGLAGFALGRLRRRRPPP